MPTGPLLRRPPASARRRDPLAGTGTELPRWPFAAMFVGFPLWWALGLGEMMWIPLAAVMVVYMVRRGGIRVPRGFGVWLLFIVWMALSVIGVDTSGRLIAFVYRAASYLAVTIVFVYVYNARRTMTTRYVLGVLTVFWLVVVAGGYLGVLFPLFSFETLVGYVVPQSLQSNEVIQEMVVRRVTQYNPDSWVQVDPRPSAPFLYTNGWGNVYSMLLPLVVAYLQLVRRTRLFLPLLLAIPVSLVPAFLTLNRGMLIGIAVAIVYSAIVLALRGNVRALVGIVGIVAVLGVAAVALDVGERLDERTTASSSTEDRASLYEETFTRTLESPFFGYGTPRPSETAGAPSAGTQGQIWMVMFSHGFPGLALFLGWLVFSFLSTARSRGPGGRREPVRLALNSVLLVILVEVFYYGVVPDGLILSMTAAALLMRPRSGD